MNIFYRIGNVYKSPDNQIVIIYEITKERIKWISFNAEGSSGSTLIDDTEKECLCQCQGSQRCLDCDECNDTGYVMKKIPGFVSYKYLAPNVKQYIISRMLKNFDF